MTMNKCKDNQNINSYKNSRAVVLATIGISVIIGYGIGYMCNKVLTNGWLWQSILFAIGFVIIAYVIQLNLHEFGHLVVGKLLGYQLLSFRVGCLAWNYENGRMKFNVVWNHGYSGLCAMIMPEKDLKRYKYAIYTAGGILTNLLSGYVLMYCALKLNMPEIASLLFVIIAGVGVLYGIINLMPLMSGNSPTDGKMLWGLMLGRPFAKQYMNNYRMMLLLSEGCRPKDIQVPPISNGPSNYDMTALSYNFYKSIDSGNLEDAIKYARLLERNIDTYPNHSLATVYYNLCFIGCVTGNRTKAIEYYHKAKRILLKDMDANGLRVKAYYEYYINRDMKTALSYCERALSVVDQYPLKGWSIMEENLLKQLKSRILQGQDNLIAEIS